jgi:hypothetical protein
LTAGVSYSNDNGKTYNYTPLSGGRRRTRPLRSASPSGPSFEDRGDSGVI